MIQRFEYAAYGRESFALNPNLSWDPAFTGQQCDIETGLYYYRARYYNPILGRFIQPDTIVQDPLDPQSWNRYAYVRNNPLKYTDPTGHWTDPATGMTDMLDDPTDVFADGLDDGGAVTETELAESESDSSGGSGRGSSRGNNNADIGEITVWGDDPKDSGNGPLPENSVGRSDRRHDAGGLVGAAADIADSIAAVAGMTYDWATGSGAANRTFGPGSIQVREMMGAPGVNAARDYFYNVINAKTLAIGNNIGLMEVTNYRASFGIAGLLTASTATEQFVGSYRVDIIPINQGAELKFELTNNTSMKSFLYGIGPAYERSTFGWGGNMRQTYWWTEKRR